LASRATLLRGPSNGDVSSRRTAVAAVARVSLLISSYALPPLSYQVPEHLVEKIRIGSAVVAPLSGFGRLGVVVGFEETGGRSLEAIRAVAEDISLPESMVKLCGWTAGAAALPLPTVIRLALPPGLATAAYEVSRPAPGWPWRVGSAVSRAELRRTLGGEGSKAAEETGKVVLVPASPAQRTVEWAVAEEGDFDLRRAPRQRSILEALISRDGECLVAELLEVAGSGREALRRLVRRGAIRLEKRAEPAPVSYTRGAGIGLITYEAGVERALSQGGAWVWRMPEAQSITASAAVVRAAVKRGEQALMLAPEIEGVERLVEAFEELLPAGLTVAPYHSALGRRRAAVYEAARRGDVDVLVGTRAAVLVPVARLGAVCVVDEPNEAHRASPGYEGVPLHGREIAISRGRIEGAAAIFFSPSPSLRLYAPESGAFRLPAIEADRWPAVSVVDMRSTGAALSSTLLDACRRTIRAGGRVGVLVNRLGKATNFSCSRCGFVWTCMRCDLPLRLRNEASSKSLFCGHCGHREATGEECPSCGSDRLGVTGLTVERTRAGLKETLRIEVGLMTAEAREEEEAPVVVGTARCVLDGEWDLVAVPDADSLLFGGAGSTERGFGLLYAAAQASRDRLLVQTRSPEHHVLQSALRGDYEAFAAAELPKRRKLGYPPHAHLAEIVFEGAEETVRRAVESRLRPALGGAVEMLDPVPFAGNGGRSAWRVLLRSRQRGALAKAVALVGRLSAEGHRRSDFEARINMDPEEV
jgi:primosomal protein N' (replication factor Y) (superfamily II helicase)